MSDAETARPSSVEIVVFSILNTVAALFIIIIYYFALFQKTVSADSGYTLPMVERIYEGMRLVTDIRVSHTTAVLFLLTALRSFFSSTPPYWVYLGFQFIFLFSSAFLVYLIGLRINRAKSLACFAASMFLIASFIYEGIELELEAFVVFFSLLALLLFIDARWSVSRFFLIGLLCGLAYLSKQYGLAAPAGIGLALLLERQRPPLSQLSLVIAALCAGFFIPLLLYYSYFVFMQGMALDTLGYLVFGGWYERRPITLRMFFLGRLNSMLHVYFVPLLFLSPKLRRNRLFLAIVFTFLISLLPNLIRSYKHYFIQALPYGMLLFVYCYTFFIRTVRTLPVVRIFSVVFFLPVIKYAYIDGRWYTLTDFRAQQLQIGREINEILPPRSRVLPLTSPSYVQVCGFLPVDNLKLGHNFLDIIETDTIAWALRNAPALVVQRNSGYYTSIEERFKKVGLDLAAIIRENYYLAYVLPNSTFEIWKLRKTPVNMAIQRVLPTR